MIKMIIIMFSTTNSSMQEMQFFFLYALVYIYICISLASRFLSYGLLALAFLGAYSYLI